MNAVAAVSSVPVGAYAERRDPRPSALDRVGAAAVGPILRRVHASSRRWLAFPGLVDAAAAGLHEAGTAALMDRVEAVRRDLRRAAFDDRVVARAFAIVRE